MVRAALYARFSIDKQREASIEDQFRECARAADAVGMEIVDYFHDAGISGGTSVRPGYQAMMAAARQKKFEVIVVEDLSRLWRNRADYGTATAELEDLNINLVTCVGDDTRRDGYGLMLGIKSAIAEHYRHEISYRTRRGLEGRVLKGFSAGGRCYGYGTGSLSRGEPDVVRGIFRDRAAGDGYRRIATRLNKAGVRAPRGHHWSENTIKRILRNPRYAGKVIWGATVSQGGARDSRLTRHVMRPDGPLVTRDGPAIVDPALWAACNPGSTMVNSVSPNTDTGVEP